PPLSLRALAVLCPAGAARVGGREHGPPRARPGRPERGPPKPPAPNAPRDRHPPPPLIPPATWGGAPPHGLCLLRPAREWRPPRDCVRPARDCIRPALDCVRRAWARRRRGPERAHLKVRERGP